MKLIHADLNGRVALITGAGSGIGLAAARLFAASGASLVLNDINADRREDVLNACAEAAPAGSSANGAQHHFVPGDASDPATPAALLSATTEPFGRLDFLINNAATPGTSSPIPFEELDALSDDFWHHLLDVNLVGPFRMTRAALPALRRAKGAVVNTASTAGLGGNASSIPYAASKAGLVNMTRNLARAAAPDVRVNAVAPGFVDSGWTRDWPEQRRAAAAQKSLLHRHAQPEDIAEAMLFLCAGAAYITAQTIVIDGGRGF